MTEGAPQKTGVVQRWVLPIVFIVMVVAIFWFVGRMSMPLLGPDSELPEEHQESGCAICHRSESGFDPATLLDD